MGLCWAEMVGRLVPLDKAFLATLVPFRQCNFGFSAYCEPSTASGGRGHISANLQPIFFILCLFCRAKKGKKGKSVHRRNFPF